MKVVTICSSTDNGGFTELKRSCDHFGINLEVIIAPFVFGGQMPYLYQWCKDNPGEEFIYTDAWDTFFMDDLQKVEKIYHEAKYGMILSGEKACFPNTSLAQFFPKPPTPWQYVNGGGISSNTDFFVWLYENNIPTPPTNNDQEWLACMFLKYRDKITIDYRCKIFQTLMFAGEGDFQLNYEIHRLVNMRTGQMPVILHANGQAQWLLHPMREVYRLLPYDHFNLEFRDMFTWPRLYSDMIDKFESGHFVEVGSYKGGSLSYLITEVLNSGKDIKLTCVDLFHGSMMEEFTRNMMPVNGKFTAIAGESVKVAEQFEGESLDFVFIDACHEYEAVKDDILVWLPKVKKNGILAGHDYYAPTPGVIQAVDEIFGERLDKSYIDELCWLIKI